MKHGEDWDPGVECLGWHGEDSERRSEEKHGSVRDSISIRALFRCDREQVRSEWGLACFPGVHLWNSTGPSPQAAQERHASCSVPALARRRQE